jgi:xanthine dehydrogenase FAD-binding subunit
LPPLYTLDADVVIANEYEKKEIKIKDFITGVGKNILKEDEILLAIKIKKQHNYNFQYYEKVGQRNALSISIAGIAIIAEISDNKTIEKIKIAWGSVAPTIVYSKEIENKLIGKKVSKETIKSVFPLIEKTVSPISDIRADKDYRLKLSKNLLLRLEEICR